eukprot:3566040-Pleurochrysis_carterae.AAC.1
METHIPAGKQFAIKGCIYVPKYRVYCSRLKDLYNPRRNAAGAAHSNAHSNTLPRRHAHAPREQSPARRRHAAPGRLAVSFCRLSCAYVAWETMAVLHLRT